MDIMRLIVIKYFNRLTALPVIHQGNNCSARNRLYLLYEYSGNKCEKDTNNLQHTVKHPFVSEVAIPDLYKCNAELSQSAM